MTPADRTAASPASPRRPLRASLTRALTLCLALGCALALPGAPLEAVPPGLSTSVAACALDAEGSPVALPPANRAAYIIIRAAFDRTTVTIDGEPYRQRCRVGHIVSANTPHEVIVKDNDRERTKRYVIRLRPRQKRILMVDLSGEISSGVSANTSPAQTQAARRGERAQEEDEQKNGYLTVNARPDAQVYIDGNLVSRRTPLNRHQLSVGSHTVRVFYIEERQFSETRRAVITDGRHISLFFQKR